MNQGKKDLKIARELIDAAEIELEVTTWGMNYSLMKIKEEQNKSFEFRRNFFRRSK